MYGSAYECMDGTNSENLAWAHKRPYAYNHTHKYPNMHKWSRDYAKKHDKQMVLCWHTRNIFAKRMTNALPEVILSVRREKNVKMFRPQTFRELLLRSNPYTHTHTHKYTHEHTRKQTRTHKHTNEQHTHTNKQTHLSTESESAKVKKCNTYVMSE